MVKKFTISCKFGETSAPYNIYVGTPVADAHPLEQQAAWLLRERGGVVPVEVMESFSKLQAIALENGVNFEELCVYALGTTENSPGGA
jgi:Domain of unknown function (DUF2610)